MHKRNSSVARPAPGVATDFGTSVLARRRRMPILQSLYRRAWYWLAGKRAGVQIITVQRNEFSIIT